MYTRISFILRNVSTFDSILERFRSKSSYFKRRVLSVQRFYSNAKRKIGLQRDNRMKPEVRNIEKKYFNFARTLKNAENSICSLFCFLFPLKLFRIYNSGRLFMKLKDRSKVKRFKGSKDLKCKHSE